MDWGGGRTDLSQGVYGDLVVGDGEPALFLPGAAMPAVAGLSVADALAGRLRTHMVDLPGGGGSAAIEGRATWQTVADWAAGYLDGRGIDRAVAIGHSLGAMCLLALADVHPERVRALVLLDGGYRDLPRLPVGEIGPVAVVTPVVATIEPLLGPGLLRPFQRFFPPPRVPTGAEADAQASAWGAVLGSRVDAAYVRRVVVAPAGFSAGSMAVALAMYRARLARRLAAVRVPTLVAYATWPDRPDAGRGNAAAIARLRAVRPDIRTAPVAGGHYVHWVDPDGVHAAIRALLDDAQPAG